MYNNKLLVNLGNAEVCIEEDTIIIRTCIIERKWEWVAKGFVTTGLKNLITGKEWVVEKKAVHSDWSLTGVTDNTDAVLNGITARKVTKDHYTSEHIEVVADINYPASNIRLQFIIWVYPDSPGIRTQLSVKGDKEYTPVDSVEDKTFSVDFVPTDWDEYTCRAVGYYNCTDARNSFEEEIIKEEIYTDFAPDYVKNDWASILSIEDKQEGLILIKESHKCVNNSGHDTGEFIYNDKGIIVTGAGLRPHEILIERFRPCWATWCILYDGEEDERELAIKVFDRMRYPVDPKKDLYIMANTWGSTPSPAEGENAACEKNILREIKSQSELGIDVQQIDDGWQNPPGLRWYYTKQWRPNPERYPFGWKRIVEEAKVRGVKLGLWVASAMGMREGYPGRPANIEELKQNLDEGGFCYFKFDFAYLDSYQKIEEMMNRVKELIEYSGYNVRVNWDVTNNWPRVGYFYGREYGNIYLENRKPQGNNVYKPALVLQDAWNISKYINLNKFQVPVQNIERVDREVSNAYEYNHSYCVGITLMGSPIFFQETHLYNEEARKEIASLLAIYKKYRKEIFTGYVFPIGDKPNDSSWTGFQCHIPDKGTGYIILFRELENCDLSRQITLKFIKGKKIRMINLLGENVTESHVSNEGKVSFSIKKVPAFKFYRYEVI